MNPDSRIFVAGHTGLVGSAVVRRLREEGFSSIILRTRAELDLRDQAAVHRFFTTHDIEYVILAAARVGGIQANSSQQADFLYDNLSIITNVIRAAAENNVAKLMCLGSSCMYPRNAPQPIREEELLRGPLEPTNEGYALAKIVGSKLCEMYQRQYGKRFFSAIPTNVYGEGDNFDPQRSHVIPGIMRRFHEAKVSRAPSVTVWGTGSARREFLHVDDLARAIHVLMTRYEEPSPINVGVGSDLTIPELAGLMREVTGYTGDIVFDSSKPDGMPRKLLDSSRIERLGWRPEITLREGLARTYAWVLAEGVLGRAA